MILCTKLFKRHAIFLSEARMLGADADPEGIGENFLTIEAGREVAEKSRERQVGSAVL